MTVWTVLAGIALAGDPALPDAAKSNDAYRRADRQGVWAYRVGLGAAFVGGIASELEGRTYRDIRFMGEAIAGVGVASMLAGSIRSQGAVAAMGHDVDPYVAYVGAGLLGGATLLWGASLRSDTPIPLKTAAGTLTFGAAMFAVHQRGVNRRAIKGGSVARASHTGIHITQLGIDAPSHDAVALRASGTF